MFMVRLTKLLLIAVAICATAMFAQANQDYIQLNWPWPFQFQSHVISAYALVTCFASGVFIAALFLSASYFKLWREVKRLRKNKGSEPLQELEPTQSVEQDPILMA